MGDEAGATTTRPQQFVPLLRGVNVHKVVVGGDSKVLPARRELHLMDHLLPVLQVDHLRQISGNIKHSQVTIIYKYTFSLIFFFIINLILNINSKLNDLCGQFSRHFQI